MRFHGLEITPFVLIGKANHLHEIMSIVHPDTLLSWHRRMKKSGPLGLKNRGGRQNRTRPKNWWSG